MRMIHVSSGNNTDVLRSIVLDTDGGGQNGYTDVERFEVAGLTLPSGTITVMRVTFQAGNAEALIITNAYIGHAAGAGDAYDFSTTPVQLTFSGSASVTISAGSTVTSDWVAFAYDKTSALLIAFYMGGGAAADTIRYKTGLTNVVHYNKAGNDAATVNKTGYSATSGSIASIASIESDGF